LRPTCPIPLTDIGEAVAEIERVGSLGFRGIILPALPPVPYHSRELDPVWAAAQASGTSVFMHVATGGVKVNAGNSETLEATTMAVLMPGEYVKRQFHVSFQDDPAAVACSGYTGAASLMWGMDYPHAEGTFRRTRELLAELFAGVPDEDRQAIVGGNIAKIMGFEGASRGN
jgi:predicted TIM-barrel fold metal-dependent hydrolase